ncbi:MAG: hypothetical protein Q9224_001003 [Gallowayella concinna]
MPRRAIPKEDKVANRNKRRRELYAEKKRDSTDIPPAEALPLTEDSGIRLHTSPPRTPSRAHQLSTLLLSPVSALGRRLWAWRLVGTPPQTEEGTETQPQTAFPEGNESSSQTAFPEGNESSSQTAFPEGYESSSQTAFPERNETSPQPSGPSNEVFNGPATPKTPASLPDSDSEDLVAASIADTTGRLWNTRDYNRLRSPSPTHYASRAHRGTPAVLSAPVEAQTLARRSPSSRQPSVVSSARPNDRGEVSVVGASSAEAPVSTSVLPSTETSEAEVVFEGRTAQPEWYAVDSSPSIPSSPFAPEATQSPIRGDDPVHRISDDRDIPVVDVTDWTEADLDASQSSCNQTLDQAMRPWCNCTPRPEDYPPLPADASSLAELSSSWNGFIPEQFCDTDAALPSPLRRPDMLPRDGSLNDFQAIPWASLLAGSEEPYSLDFAKSEERFLQERALRNIQLERTWDVDSCLAELHTLAAHKHPFRLSYCPPFSRRITQNQRVTFQGHAAHKCKQLRLGYSAGDSGCGFSTHVLFPNMQVFNETHLSLTQQQYWFENVIGPALQASCERHVLSRHPTSLRTARNKARMKREVIVRDHGQPMDYRCPIPVNDLAEFWSHVKRLANQSRDYSELILIISAHDLKIDTARKHPDTTRRDWMTLLESLYHTGPTYVVQNSIWVDFGVDEYGVVDEGPGITLINKAPCLDSWANTFQDPGSRHHRIKKSFFPFMMTRDAGSVSVELLQGNDLRDKHGLAYHKRYNGVKELFTSPFKDVLPFCNPSLEAIGFEQAELDRWYAVNFRGTAGYTDPETGHEAATDSATPGKKVRLVEFYTDVKRRIAGALEEAIRKRKDYGVRHEYRLQLRSFEQLRFIIWNDTFNHREDMFPGGQSPRINTENPTSEVSCHSLSATKLTQDNIDSIQQIDLNRSRHRRFYILPTQEVAEFIAASINRWLLLIEAKASQSSRGPGHLLPATPSQQRIHGILIAAMLRTIRLTLGGLEPSAFPQLWLSSWVRRKRRRPQRPDIDQNERPRKRHRGLGYKEIVVRHGVSSLPKDHLQWEGIPSFTPEFLRQLTMRNGFQTRFRAQRDIAGALTLQDRLLEAFRDSLQHALRLDQETARRQGFTAEVLDVVMTGVQLVIQEYIREVFRHTKYWAIQNLRKGAQQATWSRHCAGLTAEELDGQLGLSFDMVSRLYGPGIEPRIAQARLPRNDRNSPRTQHFAEYHASGLWRDRVRALFAWNDLPIGSNDRAWENEGFRQLAKRLHFIVKSEAQRVGKAEELARSFMTCLACAASKALLIIPQYDQSRMAVTYKANSNHSSYARAQIKELLPIQTMNWWIAHVPSKLNTQLRRATKETQPDAPNKTALRNLLIADSQWLRCSYAVDWESTAIKHPLAQLGVSLRLARATRFREENLADRDESDEDDSGPDTDASSESSITSDFAFEDGN